MHADNKLAVIADDLTGACDTACQFALYGFRPEVVHAAARNAVQAEFLACNSESRKDDARMAQQKVFDIASELLRARYLPFYKKLDSTLKGPWRAELAGMVKATLPELVVVAPAFPAWGRTTIDGVQYVHGRPVWESRFHALPQREGRPLVEPSDLIQALQAQFGKRVRHFRRASLKKGPASVAREMEAAQFRGFPFLVFDAAEEEDLKTIVLAGCRLEKKILWAGSGGLARALPLGWGCRQKSGQPEAQPLCLQTLVVNGSFNPANKDQLACLEERGTAVWWIEDEDADDSLQTREKIERLLQALDNHADAALSVRLNKPIRSAAHLQRLQDALQSAAMRCLKSRHAVGLILVGGDTAMKLYRRMLATAIRIEGEVQPGVPHGRWVGGRLEGQPVVTKAGGFGQLDTLAKAVAFLKGE